jgi:hypothetical protein
MAKNLQGMELGFNPGAGSNNGNQDPLCVASREDLLSETVPVRLP